MLYYIILGSIGIFAGGVGALIGVGGGFVVIPVMFLGMQMPAQAVIGISLTMVFFNALSSSFVYWKQKRIDFSSGGKFILATVPGALLGSKMAAYFTQKSFGVVFGIILVSLALLMFFRRTERTEATPAPERPAKKGLTEVNLPGSALKKKRPGWVGRVYVDDEGKGQIYYFNEYLGVSLSLGVGFLSSALGIGGGIIHVPLMVMLMRFPPHIATATSLFVLTGSSLVGALSHLFLGHFDWPPAVALSIGGFLGAQIIARQSVKIRAQNLLRAFSLVLFFVGARMILS